MIQDNFGGDRNAFIKTMESQKYSMSKFRDMEREKIIVQAMRAKNVKSNLLIPPAKVEEYYRQHQDLFSSKAQVKLRMIMIPGHADNGGSAAQKSMAEEIRAKLITGADFDKMAQMYSEDSTRDLGGDWGWIDDKTLSAPLSQVAFSLKPGEISKVVDVGGNYYILKVEARQGGEMKPLKDVRAEIEAQLAPGTGAAAAGTLARQPALEGLHQDLLSAPKSRLQTPPAARVSWRATLRRCRVSGLAAGVEQTRQRRSVALQGFPCPAIGSPV